MSLLSSILHDNNKYYFFVLSQFVIDPPSPGAECKVCHLPLDQPSPCSNTREVESEPPQVVCLSACQHRAHLACLKSLAENQPGGPMYLRCPKCDALMGERWGDQPPTGDMSYRVLPKGLPGHEDYHSIQVRRKIFDRVFFGFDWFRLFSLEIQWNFCSELKFPDRYFLPNSNVILFYEKIYYIRIPFPVKSEA